MTFRGCWSCGAHGPCDVPNCLCAKCIDPELYAEWRAERPDQYDTWLGRQQIADDESCDCPGCF